MHGTDHASSTTSDRAARPQRVASGRRVLPTGRALVGGLLVTLAAVVVFAAWAGAQEHPTSTVVVARRDVEPGDRIDEDDLELTDIDVPPELAAGSFTAIDQLVGSVALGPVGAGELVQRGAVGRDQSAAGRQFSFAVASENALAGTVRSGEVVDLLATFGTGAEARTELLAQGARVLQVREAGTSALGSSGRLVLTVSLATGGDVIEVAHAAQVAVITLVRGGAADGTETSGSRPAPSTSPATGDDAAPIPGAGS